MAENGQPAVPTANDAFGAHTSIAAAVAQLIADDPASKHGRAIALTGSWGSGKSFVVDEVKGRLQEPQTGGAEHRVFVFDAWAHEGDALGRAFLKQLADFLCKSKGEQPTADWILETDYAAAMHRIQCDYSA